MRLVLCGLMLVVVPVVAFGPLAAEEPANAAPIIYECKDADGNVSFQDDPCPVAPPKPKAAPKPKPAAKAKPEATPKAAAKTSAAAKPPDATKTLAGTKLSATTKPAEKAKPKRALLPPLTLPAPPSGRIDPRWATPESALRTFVTAVNAGDRALAVSCLTSSALADLGPGADALPLEALQEEVGTFTGYVPEGDLGPYWSIRALREGGRPKWIFFERTGSGEWKIGGI